MASKKKTKKESQAEFLQAFQQNGYNVSQTCEKTGISKSGFYQWEETDPEFREQIESIRKRRRKAIIDQAERILADHMELLGAHSDPRLALDILKTTLREHYGAEVREEERKATTINISFAEPTPKTDNGIK